MGEWLAAYSFSNPLNSSNIAYKHISLVIAIHSPIRHTHINMKNIYTHG